MDNDIAIEFKHVFKTYRLYKTDKQRFRAIFNKKIQCKIKDNEFVIVCDASEDMSFEKWAFENRSVMFEDVMGIKPVLKTRREG